MKKNNGFNQTNAPPPNTPSNTQPNTPTNSPTNSNSHKNDSNEKRVILTQYNLLNTDNYNNNLCADIHAILDKYVLLIMEYLSFVFEKISVKHELYFKYIVARGVDTITHVFNGMLYYTKNLDLSYYHSQKAFYFYVEFIEQISNTQNSFLKLSSRDATLFVYKRTLFEIHAELVKPVINSAENENKLQMLKVYCEIYKSASSFYVNNPEFKFTIEYFLEKIKKISGKLNYLIVDSTTLNNVQIFINHLSNKNIQILNDKYFGCLSV